MKREDARTFRVEYHLNSLGENMLYRIPPFLIFICAGGLWSAIGVTQDAPHPKDDIVDHGPANEPATLRDIGLVRLDLLLDEFARDYFNANASTLSKQPGASAGYDRKHKVIFIIAVVTAKASPQPLKELCRNVLLEIRSAIGVNKDTGVAQFGGGSNVGTKHTFLGEFFSHAGATPEHIASADAALAEGLSIQVSVMQQTPEVKLANCKGALLSTESVVLDPPFAQ
jgi:hypothetical protein